MSNLEKLGLYFATFANTLIDGDNLQNNILNHMSRLKKFIFNICSKTSFANRTYLPPNKRIQRILTNLGGNQVISSVDYFPKQKVGQYHIYSYPYTMRCYNGITNNFPGGLFKYVQEISLFDESPFEHDFFIRISKAFPSVKKLSLNNKAEQKRKQCEESNNENENLSIIDFRHLTELHLDDVHNDYIAQFLMHTKTCLATNLRLCIGCDILYRVIDDFKQDAIRINCAKVKYLYIGGTRCVSDEIYVLFPNAIIV
jgi:hypothetical protein